MLRRTSLATTTTLVVLGLFSTLSAAYPSLWTRTDPQFPAQPPSCPICAQGYGGISSCAQAAPVLANFSMIIFNPGAFIDVIKCACTDTFQSVYPQCVDCFEKTNQTSFLDADAQDLPGILSGLHSVCAVASTILGNVSESDGETTPSGSPVATVTPSASTNVSGSGLLAVIDPYTLLAGLGFVVGVHFLV